MTSNATKTQLYLAAFLVSMLIFLAMSGRGFETLAAFCLLYAIVFSASVFFLERGRASLTIFILVSLLYANMNPVQCTGASWLNASENIRCFLRNEAIWLGVPSTLFAGLCLHVMTSQQHQQFRIVSLAPDIAFGGALLLSIYSLLQISIDDKNTFLPQNIISVLWGESLIHYTIIILFLIILSHIIRCYFGNVIRRRMTAHENPKFAKLLPEERTLRWFVRVLIGTLPLLGFLGTVFGITQAMSGLPALFETGDGTDSALLNGLSNSFGNIAIAFETTMLGLVASLISSVSLSYVEKLDTDLETEQALLHGGS